MQVQTNRFGRKGQKYSVPLSMTNRKYQLRSGRQPRLQASPQSMRKSVPGGKKSGVKLNVMIHEKISFVGVAQWTRDVRSCSWALYHSEHLRPRRTPMDGVYAASRPHSPFQQMYVRTAVEGSLSGNAYTHLICRCFKIVQFLSTNFPCRTGALTRFRVFVPHGRDIVSFQRALSPYKLNTE